MKTSKFAFDIIWPLVQTIVFKFFRFCVLGSSISYCECLCNGENIPTYNVHSIGMNNWICYGHLDYYVLIEFELYYCKVKLRKVRLYNRLIFRLWNLIHSILKICKIGSQIYESSNLNKQLFLESIWLFKTMDYFSVN